VPVKTFDEKDTVTSLDAMLGVKRVAFAFACADRLAPAYRAFHALTGYGDPLMLESTLELIIFPHGQGDQSPEEERAGPALSAPPGDIQLLPEIRDSLKSR